MTPHDQARRLRDQRQSYKAISLELGVSEMTVYAWLNPQHRQRKNRLHRDYRNGERPLQKRDIYRWARTVVNGWTDHERRIVAQALSQLEEAA